MSAFELSLPESSARPVLVEVPHAGLLVPDSVRSELLAPEDAVLKDADIYVDRLYQNAPRLGAALLAFAAGFAVRPFGAVFFGRIGDLVGRKYTFLITILIMGLSTFLVGLLPSYASIGVAALAFRWRSGAADIVRFRALPAPHDYAP